jgi:hypothetical protein
MIGSTLAHYRILRPLGTGGRLDGRSPGKLVYTLPVSAGFASIEAELQSVVEKFSNVEWFYGNVYDPADGVTPLNWWLRDGVARQAETE